MIEEFRWIIGSFAAIGIVFIIYFVWNLITAPPKMERDLKEEHTKEINTLKEKNASLKKAMLLTSSIKPCGFR